MNIYIYKLWTNACPSLWEPYAVRAESQEVAGQWQNWIDAPKHDHAELVGEIKEV